MWESVAIAAAASYASTRAARKQMDATKTSTLPKVVKSKCNSCGSSDFMMHNGASTCKFCRTKS